MTRPLRVLHCPTTVGGNPPGLARAERALGLDSCCSTLRQNYLLYPADEVLVPDWAHGPLAAVLAEAGAWRLLGRACQHLDLVHLNYGGPLLPTQPPASITASGPLARLYRLYADAVGGLDLRLLRRAGVGIVTTYQGDDARQGDVCTRLGRPLVEAAGAGYYTIATDRAKRLAIARMDRYAQRIFYLNPDLGRVLPARARFIPYAHLDPQQWTPTWAEHERPLLVHAPTHTGIKGTAQVLAAVDRLRGEGLAFDFRLIQGLPHHEAMRLYAAADLLVDQLLIGWYGGLAVEFMALGKPVVCCLRQEDFRYLPAGMASELPIIHADPSSVTDVLRRLLGQDRRQLRQLGLRGRLYVEHWHEPRRIAAGLAVEYAAAANEARKIACAA